MNSNYPLNHKKYRANNIRKVLVNQAQLRTKREMRIIFINVLN